MRRVQIQMEGELSSILSDDRPLSAVSRQAAQNPRLFYLRFFCLRTGVSMKSQPRALFVNTKFNLQMVTPAGGIAAEPNPVNI